MNYSYTKRFDTSYTSIDRSGRLGLVESLDINQDMITEFFGAIGSDNLVLRTKNNAAWVYTRTKMKIDGLPFWNTKTIAKSYVCSKSPIRLDIETVLTDEAENVLFTAKTQMCAIDFVKRSLCKISDITFPSDLDAEQPVLAEPFSKLNGIFTEDDFVLEEKIYASDTDFTRHTNNARYVKYLMNTFDADFYDTKTVAGFEIQFAKESTAGDVVRIYKKQTAAGRFDFLIKNGEEVIVKAELSYSDKAPGDAGLPLYKS